MTQKEVVYFLSFLVVGALFLMSTFDNIESPPREEKKTPTKTDIKVEEKVPETEIPDDRMRELEYCHSYDAVQTNILESTKMFLKLLDTYKTAGHTDKWLTDMSLTLYLLEANGKALQNLTVPPYFKEKHDQYMREGVEKLLLFSQEMTEALDEQDSRKMENAVLYMEEYTNAYLRYNEFVVDRLQIIYRR